MKIIIAYHIYLYGDHYVDMIIEQFRLLLYSDNLYQKCDKLYIGIVDSDNTNSSNRIQFIKDYWKLASKVEIVVYDKNNEEADTLKWIRDYAINNPDDYVLYFHTKGISKLSPATEDWRRYMEYFVIEKWKDCINKLNEGFDCCGVLWNTDTPIGVFPHFSGNMWWANTNYINTLNHSYLDLDWRYYREFWIGSNLNAKVYEFHNSGLNDEWSLIAGKGHYDVLYPKSNYENK